MGLVSACARGARRVIRFQTATEAFTGIHESGRSRHRCPTKSLRRLAVPRAGASALCGRARPWPGIGLGLSAPAPYRHRRARSDRSCLEHRGGAHPLGAPRPRDREPANVLHSARRHRGRVSAACARRLVLRVEGRGPVPGVSWRHRSCSRRSAGPTRTRSQGSKRFAVISPSTRRESIVLSTASVWRHNRAAFMADGSPLKLSARSRAPGLESMVRRNATNFAVSRRHVGDLQRDTHIAVRVE